MIAALDVVLAIMAGVAAALVVVAIILWISGAGRPGPWS